MGGLEAAEALQAAAALGDDPQDVEAHGLGEGPERRESRQREGHPRSGLGQAVHAGERCEGDADNLLLTALLVR